jgi:hypothetical protein
VHVDAARHRTGEVDRGQQREAERAVGVGVTPAERIEEPERLWGLLARDEDVEVTERPHAVLGEHVTEQRQPLQCDDGHLGGQRAQRLLGEHQQPLVQSPRLDRDVLAGRSDRCGKLEQLDATAEERQQASLRAGPRPVQQRLGVAGVADERGPGGERAVGVDVTGRLQQQGRAARRQPQVLQRVDGDALARGPHRVVLIVRPCASSPAAARRATRPPRRRHRAGRRSPRAR